VEKNSSSSYSNSSSNITVTIAVAEVILVEVGIIWEMEKRKEDDHKEEKNCKRMKEGGHSLRMRRMEEKMQIRRRRMIK
jgi:hypothetical protein